MNKAFNPLDFSIAYQWPRRLVEPEAWVEHIPFAMVLMELAQPGIFVELGTHSGNSYCAFCQAVLELNLNTKCYAVDTWEGDKQAGEYGPEVYEALQEHHDPIYGHFSNLIKSTFDNAVDNFKDGTVDLLHIDGLHTYEAVKHDFTTWQPKLSSRAIVILHDTNVRRDDFGVWRLWQQLQRQYPSFEFFHGNGLGVLFVGDDPPTIIKMLLKEKNQQNQIREHFQSLGARLLWELRTRILSQQIDEKVEINRVLNERLAQQHNTLESANIQLNEKNTVIAQLKDQLKKNHNLVEELDSAIRQLEEKNKVIAQLKNQLGQCHKNIEELNALNDQLKNCNQNRSALKNKVNRLNANLADCNQTIASQKAQINAYEQEVLFYSLSKSWRFTRPLRKLVKFFKGKKND